MQQVTVEELINYKILPFDIFTQGDELLFSAGEVITPGKFLQLRHIDFIYKKIDGSVSNGFQEILQDDEDIYQKPKTPVSDVKSSPGIDQIDISKVRSAINKRSKIAPEEQLKIKAYYGNVLENTYKTPSPKVVDMYQNIRDKIFQDFSSIFNNTVYPSQIRLLGEYEKCHALNVAILSASLAFRLDKTDDFIADIILAALLHDVGKNHLPPNILTRPSLSSQQQKIFQSHSQLGYDIIKKELGLAENIARVALEHHEKNDGTGYPKGKSGNLISLESQIVAVCNYFDNLTFNKTLYKVKNGRDALKIMLEKGSRIFATDVLYTFVYMFNYDDTMNFEEMVL